MFLLIPLVCAFLVMILYLFTQMSRDLLKIKNITLKAKMEDVVREILQQDLAIGSVKLEVEGLAASQHSDVQSQLLHEIRQKLFGRNATARGSIMFVHDELWFFPNQIQLS